ncbi:MAG: cupin-like domain-containing protein [Gammaproteobacteria bacterium]|nr:cupin-like domain-containing protein [Gammaproteobacteria bacterium]
MNKEMAARKVYNNEPTKSHDCVQSTSNTEQLAASAQTKILGTLAAERLSSLITPISTDHFFKNIWPDNIHYTQHAGALVNDFINQEEFRDLSSLLNIPFKGLSRVNFNNQDDITSKTGLRPEQMLKAYQLFQATIYLQDLQMPLIQSWKESLDTVLNLDPGTSRVGCFISPIGKGHHWHYDPYETIIVQVSGEKRWYLASDDWQRGIGLGHDRMLEYQEWAKCDKSKVPTPEKYQTFDLKPGSVLFIPYGHWHTVENLTESVHLVLNVSRSYLLTGTKP